MPTQVSQTQIADAEASAQGFSGGLNLRDAISLLQPNELSKGENVVLEERGGVSKRSGCLSKGTFGAGADRILSMYTFYRGASVPQMLIHTSAGTLYYTADPNASPIVWTQITTGLSASVPFSFETFNNKCYFSNGVDSYAAWDGSTYTTFPSAPKGRYLRLYRDAMWVSGIAGAPDRVYSSDPGNPESFSVSSWVDIAHGDGDQITALGTDGTFLICFKRRRTMHIYDPTTFANKVVDFEKGCESHFSVIQFESSTYFFSRRGICEYLGDSPSRYLSYKLDPLWDERIINLNVLDKVTSYVTGNRIGWAVPEVGSAVPSFQIEYYPRLSTRSGEDTPSIYGETRGPFMIQRMPTMCFAGYRSGSSDHLFAAHNAANKVLQAFTSGQGTDDGATFQGMAETALWDFAAKDRVKYLRRLRLLGRGKFQIQVKRNYQSAIYKSYAADLTQSADLWSLSDQWGVGVWGPDSNIKSVRIDTDIYGRTFILRIVDAETSTATRPISVGSSDYATLLGAWSLLDLTLESTILGVRE